MAWCYKNNSITRFVSKARQSNQALFIITCIVVIAFTTEVSLAKNYNLIESPSIFTYLIMAIVYTLGQLYFLDLVRRKTGQYEKKERLNAISYKIVRICQSVLVSILFLLSIQMLFTSYYSMIAVIIVITISYTIAAIMLGILAQHFFSWFSVHRTFTVLIYGLSAGTLAINAVITLGFISISLSMMYNTVGPHTGQFSYIGYPGSLQYFLNLAYSIFSILSFILTWLATAFLLYPYSKKLGTVKYWIIVSLPLVYFLSQFPPVFLNLFDSVLNSDPIFYNILLTTAFVLSKASGGILFGIAFWILATKTPPGSLVKDYLIIAAIGYVLLFVADQAIVFLSVPYPPLGLASISFMGLSSYLILTGIYSSAIYISQDSKLRRIIRNIAIGEPRLLGSIGTAHMEQEIEKRVFTLLRKNREILKEETGINALNSDEAMKEYLQEVLKEVKFQKKRT